MPVVGSLKPAESLYLDGPAITRVMGMRSDLRTTQHLLRMALGPGVQSYGPTEQLLRLVACDADRTGSHPNGYCQTRATESRRRYDVLEELGVFPGLEPRTTRPTS